MTLDNKNQTTLVRERHITYFLRHLHMVSSKLSNFDSTRLTLSFFAISGLDVLNGLNKLSVARKKEICDWIYSLQLLPGSCDERKQCGFQGGSTLLYKENNCTNSIAHYSSGHVAMTYTGLAALVILGDDLLRVDRKACIEGVRALQQPDGSFSATLTGGENDMRFVYCAACVCHILNDWSGMDVDRTVSYIQQSMNYDFGIGQNPDLESHGGVTYCAVAALSLMGRLHSAFNRKQIEGLKRWAIMRQVSGFQGRPNKPEDTCYSFWVGGTLKLLGIYEMIDYKENRDYLMTTQDSNCGGFSKWPDSYTDPMHSYLGLSGLSVMGEDGLLPVDAALNITKRAADYLKTVQESWTL